MKTKSQRSSGKLGGCLRNVLVGLAVLLIAAGAAGASYQIAATASDQRNFPAPGERVDVGGFSLHLRCTGTAQAGSPTVILEALSGGMSPYWIWVQSEVEKTTRVCSYDRPGRAWSDPAPAPPTLDGTVQNLHTLLQSAGEPGPYLLVGHSIGGLFVRAYADRYPQEVSGMVLLDASHPQQFERYPEMLKANREYGQMLAWFPWIARLGIFHLYFAMGGEIDFQDLPERQHDEVAAFWSSPIYFETMKVKLAASEAIFKDAQALGDLGDLPLAVISAGTGSAQGWGELQAELALLSTNATHTTIAEASHASLVFNPDHALQVAQITLDLAQKVNR